MSTETILAEAVSTANEEAALASEAFGDNPAVQNEPAAEPARDQPQEPQADDAQDDAEEAIDYFDDFASKYELDPDALYGLKFKLKIDGEEKEATLRDLIKVNQLEGHVNRKSIELSEKQKAWEAEQVKYHETWQQRIGMASTSLDAQEAQLQQQYNSVDWNTMFQTNPGEYAAWQQRFQQAYQQVQGQKQQLAQHVQQTRQQYRDSLLPKAAETIRAQNPDLTDSASYGNALAEMKAYLKEKGADERSYEALELDPLVFNTVRDAARYRAMVSKQADIAQKVKTAPKFEKPGAKDSVGAKQTRMNDLRKRADAGDEKAIAELFFQS